MQEDMLVKLYDLPTYSVGQYDENGVQIKRAMAPERSLVVNWVAEQFGDFWKSECQVAFSLQPIGCFVAYREGEIVGFSCYNTTAKGFFGPTGVLEANQGQGIGTALLMESLYALKYEGYAYAIIGRVGPVEYYQKVVGAQIIAGSNPGLYKNLLR